MTKITPLKAIGSGVDANGDVTGAVVALKEYAAGDTIPVEHLGTGTPTGSTVLKGDGTWGTSVSAIADLTYFNMADALNEASVTMASASTMNIGAAAGNYITVTGTTTITGFDTVQAGARRTLKFNSSLVLTHNATSLVLPGGADITTAAGDCFTLESEGSGNWRVVAYALANGQAITTPVSLPSQTGNAGKYLTTDGSNASWGTVSSVNQSAVTYLTSGGSTTVTGKTILAAYEQTAGGTFTTPYTTEADYVQEDATNGTDHSSGTFTLHSTAGGAADSYTKLLIHADGANGSTEIVDQRGITPFGTHCAYFDGTSYYDVPRSYKLAFGSAQNFTIEGWFRHTGAYANWQYLFDCRTADASEARLAAYTNSGGSLSVFSSAGSGGAAFSNDTWHHVAAVRNSGTTTIYLDGTSVGSFADTASYADARIRFGAGTATNYYWQGWMDEFRVSKVARYTTNFTPHTTPHVRDSDTVYLFHFDDGHGSQLIRDDSRSGHEVQLAGTSALSTTQKKFGASSLKVGTSTNVATVSASKAVDNLVPGADDFTLDFWFWPASGYGGGICGFGDPAGFNGPFISVSSAGSMFAEISSNGSSFNVQTGSLGASATTDAWNHFAMCRSGSALYLFLNGTVIATKTVGTSSIFPSSSSKFWTIGGYLNSNGFNGYIDEFRLKRGVAEWTANFTPPASAHATDDRTVLLLHFDGANGDKVTPDSSESSYGTDQFGDTTIPALTFVNSAALSAAQTRGGHGTSLALNGTNQNASMTFATPSAGHPIFFGTGERFCVEAWVYFNSLTTGPLILNLYQAGVIDSKIGVNSSGKIFVATASGDITFNTNTVTTGAFHKISVVKDSRGWTCYLNGNKDASNLSPEYNFHATPTNAVTMLIGSQNAGNYLNGYVDSIRITHGKPRYEANYTPGNLTQDDDTALLWEFNGSVGQKWVKELSKNSAMISATNARTVSDGRYISTSGTPGTNYSVSTNQYKFGSASMYFNGTGNNGWALPHSGDYVPSGDFTIEAWVRVSNITSNNYIASKVRTDGGSLEWQFSVNNASSVFTYIDSTGTQIQAQTGNVISANTWTHIAAVRTAGVLKVYVNGVSQASVTATNGMRQGTAGDLRIGMEWQATNGFNGYIDELRISDTARWTANFTPSASPYGTAYVSGPHWVATKPTVSSIDLSAYSSIDSVSFTTTIQPSTTLLYLISTDGYATALKRWNGSAWVDTAYSMTWNGTTLTTSATSAQLNAVGNTQAELNTGLLAMDVSAITSLNIVAILASSNASYTPILDGIVIGTDAYAMLRPVTDYTVTKKKASGSQTLTFTRTAGSSANHVFDYIP